ncbi:type II secretion system protein E [Methanolobus psychrophilus R15]|nr:type II secretion system protein E [Methanolobus psychrophilus R15]
MADAQTGNMKNKELEKAKAEDEAFSVLPIEEASLAVERVSDTFNTDDGDQEGEGSEDTLEASNLLEKLAQIKISEQKLDDEFNSLIMKGSASSETGKPFGEKEILVPRSETTLRDKKAEIPSKNDEFNILLPKSAGFGPAKRSFPDIRVKEEPVPEKDKEAKLKVKSLLEDKSKEEKLIPIRENKAETEIEAVEETVKEEKIGFLGKVKSLFKKIEVEIEPYDPQLHGLISEFKGVEGYEEIERYWVNEPYTFIVILYNEETNHHLYYVVEPELTDFEEVFLKEIRDRLRDVLLVEDIDEDTCNKETVLESKIWSIIQDYTLEITSPMLAKISYYIKRDFIRFGKIDALMCDTSIEDVSGNGHDVPIFLYHRTYQNIPTNIVYPENELNSFIIQMAQRSGKHISVAEPIVDATMPDGSRIQMTLGTCVTAHGSTFTIRKFSETPITPVDLIKWGTFSAEAMAYLWLCIENNKSLIYAGGTASGKTSSLNAVSLFIPEKAKVITLEDTRELKLPHPNWIPSMTRDSFTADERGAVDMYDLLKAALRQRPEYLLVGEVRGKEALTLFQAMSTGHTTFSTMHADSVASAIHRLENPPISVPRSMIQALDIMSIQSQTYTKGKRVRRNIKLVEIIDIDPNTRNIRTNDIFVWDSENDVFVRTGESKALFDIKMRRGWGQGRIDEELYYRQKILEYMVNNTITDFNEISGIINAYQSRPERVLKKLQIA